jgi:hypothetical protein
LSPFRPRKGIPENSKRLPSHGCPVEIMIGRPAVHGGSGGLPSNKTENLKE